MADTVPIGGMTVEKTLYDTIALGILPGTGIEAERFFTALAALVARFGPRNAELLAVRDEMQTRIDAWHRERVGASHDPAAYEAFLHEIGYLLSEGPDFTIETSGVDPEIASIAGPQLVAPVTNARYALNAANARWGSLYDALYGTDVLPEEPGREKGLGYNPARGAQVMAYASAFLDRAAPLSEGSHSEVVRYAVVDAPQGKALLAVLGGGRHTGLARPAQFVGYLGEGEEPEAVLLVNNGLHVELVIDRSHPIGREHAAGLKDVILEAAVTAILDMEDSVAAVDGPDKALCYKNLAGLMRGDLAAEFEKGGETVSRSLAGDRQYTARQGARLTLPGRSLLLVRTVGLLMTTDAVRDADGTPIPEGILDTMVAAAAAMHDLRGNGKHRNSRAGAVYIVKPKLHGPSEVAFTCELFDAVEDALGLSRHTLKIGVMDEERRTTVNLKECVRAAKERIIFINTGFLDRTGDEIHTCMEAGPVVRKGAMKSEPWIAAYEDWNVDVGLACGFSGRAQVGKGMWPKPDMMREMVQTKAVHPSAGANCAWVPSPTAATLHAMHYHEVDVFARQAALRGKRRATLEALLTLPLMADRPTAEEIAEEVATNAQSILGYVVRWVEQGVGCSKVPDLGDVGLMEDRATLRISSQHIANWLHHGVCGADEVRGHFERMAATVDRQNANDPAYRPMSRDFGASAAFQAALDLVFKGRGQPNGYTEPILHARRAEFKARLGLT